MTVAARVRADLTAAMKGGERARVAALRLVLSELQRAQKEGSSDELAVLRRERKRRLDAAEQFRAGGRPELAEGEEREAALIAAYLPAELSDADLRQLVEQKVREAGASELRDLGRVMALVMPEVAGRADGKRVSARVREALSA